VSAKEELITIRNNLEQEVIKLIKKMSVGLAHYGKRYSILSSLLAKAELISIEQILRHEDLIKVEEKTMLEFQEQEEYGNEDKIAAISYLIYILKSKGLDSADIELPKPELVMSKKIDKLIHVACQINQISELLEFINVLGYSCEKKSNKIYVFHENEKMAKIHREGYVRNTYYTMMSVQEDHAYLKDKGIELPQLKDLFDKIFNDFPVDGLAVKCTDNGFTRFRLELPVPIIEMLVNIDEFFSEELMFLSACDKDNVFNSDIDTFLNTRIKDECTVIDYIRLRRISIFIFELYKRLYRLHKNNEKNLKALVNILSPVKSIEQTKSEYEVFADGKGSSFVDFLCYELNTVGRRDLYYQQAVESNGYIYLLNSLLANSNFPRNIIRQLKKNPNSPLNSDGSFDRLTNEIKKLFDEQKIKYKTGKEITTTDIDLIFEIDNLICVVELKNSVFPADMNEFKTTYNHIQESFVQLSKIKKYFADNSKRNILLNQMGFDPQKEIVYFTITSNRVMSNNNIFDFPVRAINDFRNFIVRGTVGVKDGRFKLWKGETLTGCDLKNFLSEQYLGNRIFNESMLRVNQNIYVGNTHIILEEYVFCWELFNMNSLKFFGSESTDKEGMQKLKERGFGFSINLNKE